MVPRRKHRPSNGYVPRTMPPFVILPVLFARRSSSRHGLRMSRTGYGKMPSRSGIACTMLAVMQRWLKTVPRQHAEVLHQGVLKLQTPYWANARLR